jgi:hypothetical protein
MSPTRLSLSMVASLQCRFRFTRRGHYISTPAICLSFRMARYTAKIAVPIPCRAYYNCARPE